jgi:alginate O-acetyltransferase complex protein AlgI
VLFNSLSFCVFFPTVTLLYFCVPHRWRWLLLLIASCVFYMAFVPAYIFILGGTIVVDYFAGLLIASAKGIRRRLWLGLSLLANVGVLCVFKYWGFFRANVAALGAANLLPLWNIVLPIGLSFHTFQAMSYTIEVYRGRQAPERHFGIYALYVMFYPQLVAGPIERPQNLLHQFHEQHSFDYERAVSGLQQMALGMFKKVVIADRLALAAHGGMWERPAQHQGLEIVAAVVFFAFQIYLDFSAYSDIAIGSARVMGFDLMKNFDTPYASASVGEFWRRWHISLSTWFRDYVYVPLGGSRHGRLQQARNIMIVFLLSGLWHGANWTFVIWGALHGAFLVVGRATERIRQRAALAIGWSETAPTRRAVRVLVTFALVTFAWIFFRAPNLGIALEMVKRVPVGLAHDVPALLMGGRVGSLTRVAAASRLLMIAALLVFEALHRQKNLFERLRPWPGPARHAVYLAIVYGTLFFAVPTNVEFIYFQF